MITATVTSAGPCLHPESSRDCMKVTVAHEYAQGGVSYPETDIWAERAMPEPQYGETISWDGRHVLSRGVRWRKVEYDSNPADPLH